jgi:hypothetical protein
MRFAYWSREVAGWALILLGLFFFWEAYTFLMARPYSRFFEAGPMVFIGFIVFRGGVHVLKVAVAAQAARSLPEQPQAAARRVGRAPTRPIGPTAPTAVLPGPKTARPAAGNRA